MATPGFSAGLQELLRMAERSVPAIICSEAVPWRCHRRLVTDALLVHGAAVYDIMSERLTRPAALTRFARTDEQSMTYPKGREHAEPG